MEVIRTNKRITQLRWTDAELRVIAQYAGKKPVEFILDEINKVSKTKRNLMQLQKKACRQGYSLSFNGGGT